MTDGLYIESNKTDDLLGIKIDQELKFDEHINYLCKKACQDSMFLPVLHLIEY